MCFLFSFWFLCRIGFVASARDIVYGFTFCGEGFRISNACKRLNSGVKMNVSLTTNP